MVPSDAFVEALRVEPLERLSSNTAGCMHCSGDSPVSCNDVAVNDSASSSLTLVEPGEDTGIRPLIICK